jgi:hypothetical protein
MQPTITLRAPQQGFVETRAKQCFYLGKSSAKAVAEALQK